MCVLILLYVFSYCYICVLILMYIVRRECIDAHMKFFSVWDGEEMSVFSKMLNIALPFAKWCIRTMSDFLYRWIQFHILFDIDDEVL